MEASVFLSLSASCYYCFIFSFFFQFLDSPSQKITMHDFHQEVTFKQYFFVCVCLDYSRTYIMNRSLFKNLWVGPD